VCIRVTVVEDTFIEKSNKMRIVNIFFISIGIG